MKPMKAIHDEKPYILTPDDIKRAFDDARSASGRDKDMLVKISYNSLRRSDYDERGRPVTIPNHDFNIEMHPLRRDHMAADLLKIYNTVGSNRILFEDVYDLSKSYDERVLADKVIPAEVIKLAKDNFEWSHKNWFERLFSKKPAEIAPAPTS